MALIAYLMEHKNNYGPHLIIVPNAVMVNWKSELTQWLPAVRCVYYVGAKEERARKFAQEVSSLQFNVLVTTYEYIMRDRTRLSKVLPHARLPPLPMSFLPFISTSCVTAPASPWCCHDGPPPRLPPCPHWSLRAHG